jgi:hypothetical protein
MKILLYSLTVTFVAFGLYFGIRCLNRFLKAKHYFPYQIKANGEAKKKTSLWTKIFVKKSADGTASPTNQTTVINVASPEEETPKKTPIKDILFPAKWWVNDAIDFGTMLVLGFLLSLIIALAFGAYTTWNAIFFLAVVECFLLWIKPSWLVERFMSKSLFASENRSTTVLSLTLILFVLLETFAFNARAYKSNSTATNYSFADTSIVTNQGTRNDDGSYAFKNGQYFIFTGNDQSANKLYLDFVNTKSLELTITVEGYGTSGNSIGSISKTVNPVVSNSCLIAIPSGASKWKVTFNVNWGRAPIGDHVNDTIVMNVKDFTLNAPIAFYFSALRFLVFSFLAYLISKLPFFVRNYEAKEKDLTKRTELVILLGGAAIFIAFSIFALLNRELYFSSYPLKNATESYDIYTQMFDAYYNKQLNLRVDLTNKLWDHAYYNNLCYSYYGVLPVLLVSFPFYWIFHVVPTSIFLESLGAIVEVQVLLILICELFRVFVKKMNPNVLYFALVAAFFTALSPVLVTYKRYFIGGDSFTWNPCVEANYHVPIVYGMLNMDLFFLLVIYALDDKKHRQIYLAFAGLAFGFIMASRPDLFVCLIFVLPLLVKMLLDKEEKLSHRLLNFVPMVVVLLFCALGIGWYNKARFGSFTDFGSSYQNTVGDVSKLSVHANQIFPAIFHYFFNPWGFTSTGLFPYLQGTAPQITSVSGDYSNYFGTATGVFAIPLFWGIFLIPFCFSKGEDPYVKAMMILFPVAMIVLAVLTYALAGICPRYMYEIFNLATIISLLAIAKFLNKESTEQRRITLPVLFAFGLLSIFICWNLSRDSFDGINSGDLSGWLERIRESFGHFNV